MCGITGYIGGEAALPILLSSLKKLEYRGYDSAGVALLDGGDILVRKTKGRISVLEEKLASEEKTEAKTEAETEAKTEAETGGKNVFGANAGIGHTRWATHGEPSDVNSHPHTDEADSIAVVHNGIIENYLVLRDWLYERGVSFRSETDTEVIAHLVTYYYQNEPEVNPGTGLGTRNILGAVRRTLSRLQGSYALAIIAAGYRDRIIVARKDSPLIIGLGRGENLVASDIPAILSRTREVLFMEDGELAVLYRDRVDLFNEQGNSVTRPPTHIDWTEEAAEKGGYAHFMLKEIHDQPKALQDTLRPRLRRSGDKPVDIDFDEINFDPRWAKRDRVVIIACGTAWHAAMVGKYAFEELARIGVEADIASEFRYRNPLLAPGDLVIVISQSGETADTLAAMRLAKKNGCHVLALTNVVGSTLSREADTVLYTWAGPEIAVASTKAFTTQLMCLYLLALKLGRIRGCLDEGNFRRCLAALEQIPGQCAELLAKQDVIQRFASRQFNKTKVFFMGRQYDYAVSLENALKLKEISYTHSEAFAAGELKHGPIALVDKTTLVVAAATRVSLFDKVVSNIREVSSRGASTLVITWEGESAFTKTADEVFFIPAPLWEDDKTEAAGQNRFRECFSPILSAVPAQLFAYYCSIQRGNDPDKPRNLAKSVTVE
ncbi:MAG: glutamine--fructose-6-phosphate transaminase (isomerizing) [Treponema sp.]|jgi:glucosamine--fructose-6-phosphate aminotransferase (isomerizing)|nr:glutamine--fructose-6-phosphate transaminase (isomerizing) [Treponema sp.]